MKYLKYTIGLVSILLVSCSNQETEVTIPKSTEEPEFYASIEGSSTRVFVDEDLNVLWNAEDQVSIFNKNTYNQPYKFLGNTGDNAGGFNKVEVAEFVTGKPINNIVSVYPYQEDIQISESGVLTVTLPKEQTYSEKTFGTGTNTMVSVSTDNYLQYKNVGGYLKLRMYGEGVRLSTIILKGNNNEKLSGKAYVTMPLDGTPSVEMASDAETEIILNIKNSVLLGSSTENCTDFWFVLPPVTFSKGFTIIVKRKDGQTFTKTASSPVTITRNNLLNMAPFEVKMEGTQPNNVIYYTTSDSSIITPRASFGLISNNYVDGIGILTFNQDVTYIPSYCFQNCSSLTSISLPESIISIERSAFQNCSGLTGNLYLPEGLTRIGDYAFQRCSSLTGNLTIPGGVTSIGNYAFEGCSGFTGSLSIPPGVTTIGSSAFSGCSGFTGNLTIQEGVTTIGNRAFEGCSGFTGNLIIPEGVTSIEGGAFAYCRSLESISLPNSLDLIGSSAFSDCSCLSRIDIPNGVLQISSGAFYNCSSLTNVTIPESITRIFYRSFSNCSNLTSIIIPEGVTSIDQEAFSNCSSLTRIDVRAINPPEGAIDMFSNTGFCPIYIPSGSEDAYLNADYWKHYALRMRIEGSNSPIAYCSSDYSQDGEVVQLQQASVGRGINIILMGDGFLDKDMTPGGKYENKMRETMEQLFSYEPYYSLRNRFNIYAVKIVSGNDIYFNENSNRALSYEHGDTISFRRAKCFDYASIVPNPYNQPLKIGVVFNSDVTISRSFCTMDLLEGHCCAFVLGLNENIINHELGGHGFAFLTDEYVEKAGYYSEQSSLDDKYNRYGYGANVDWRSNPNEVRWSRFLKDPRYGYEGLGVYEGGYLYAHGVYRATENSMMRYNDTPFNAPSREQIYKMIMKYSEGEDWVYDYEEFVKADARGRMEAAEELGPWKSPRRDTRSMAQENNHHPPVLVDNSVKEVGFDKDGNVILVR